VTDNNVFDNSINHPVLTSSNLDDYEDWKDQKGESRDRKKRKKMPVQGAGLFEVWKLKAEKPPKKTQPKA